MGILKYKGKIPLKNKIIFGLVILILLAIVTVFIVYATNEETRNWINVHILRKEVTEEDVATIEIDGDKTHYIYAYDKYITILNNGKLQVYNGYGNKAYELDVTISNPIFSENGGYLAIAENKGQNVYVISERKNRMGQ